MFSTTILLAIYLMTPSFIYVKYVIVDTIFWTGYCVPQS